MKKISIKAVTYVLAITLLPIAVINVFSYGLLSHNGKIKNICRVDSSFALNGKSGVDIEISSDEPFPIANALPVLQIGNHEFRLSRHPVSGRYTIIFTLTEEEFDQLKDGSLSSIKYDPDSQGKWNLGKLNKKLLSK